MRVKNRISVPGSRASSVRGASEWVNTAKVPAPRSSGLSTRGLHGVTYSTAGTKAKSVIRQKRNVEQSGKELLHSMQKWTRSVRLFRHAAVQRPLAYSENLGSAALVVSDLIERELDISSFHLVQSCALAKLEPPGSLCFQGCRKIYFQWMPRVGGS